MTTYTKNGLGRFIRIERDTTPNRQRVRKFLLIDGKWVMYFRSEH